MGVDNFQRENTSVNLLPCRFSSQRPNAYYDAGIIVIILARRVLHLVTAIRTPVVLQC